MKSPKNSKQESLSSIEYNFQEDTISLTDILLVLIRQLKIIIITPTIICIITIIYVLNYTSPVYTSTAKIISSSGGNEPSAAAGIAAQFGINIPSGGSLGVLGYPEILKSRTFARTVLDRKFDTEKFGNQKSLLQILTYGDQEPTVGLDTLYKYGINSVISMIKIQQNGSFYTLTVTASEPLFARDFAEVIIEELNSHQMNYNKAKTLETKRFILDRISNVEKDLAKREEELKDFRVRNRRIENSPALQLKMARISREVSVITGVYTTLKQQLETTKIEEVKKSDYVIVIDPPEAPLSPSGPKKKLMVIMSGFFGIGLGLFLGIMREFYNNSSDETKEKIGVAKFLLINHITDLIPKKFSKIK